VYNAAGDPDFKRQAALCREGKTSSTAWKGAPWSSEAHREKWGLLDAVAKARGSQLNSEGVETLKEKRKEKQGSKNSASGVSCIGGG